MTNDEFEHGGKSEMSPRADRKGGDEQDHDDSAVGLTYQWWLYGCERLCKTVMSPALRYHLCVRVHVSPYMVV